MVPQGNLGDILLKKALYTHNKHPLKEANVFAWTSVISLPCHFLDCSVDTGNMKMVVILSYCGREIIMNNECLIIVIIYFNFFS